MSKYDFIRKERAIQKEKYQKEGIYKNYDYLKNAKAPT